MPDERIPYAVFETVVCARLEDLHGDREAANNDQENEW
jgi:hypothetical protein